jgi:hypothetical protein
MFDVLASAPQYADHLIPVWREGGGTFWTRPEMVPALAALGVEARPLVRDTITRPVLVASISDLSRARRRGAPGIAYMEHGCGQSYPGDPRTKGHGAYAGGRGREVCGLILAPNAYAAALWSQAYPAHPVEIIGATRILPPPGGPPTLAVSFHWSGAIPEQRNALAHYRAFLPMLSLLGFPVIGHSHPRFAGTARKIFARAGIPYVADIEEVARRATVYAVDNSSTLWEMGRTRPVIALDAPWYRREIQHGLRFWTHVPLAVDGPDALLSMTLRLLSRGETDAERERRERLVGEVIPRLDGAVRAATLVREWVGTAHQGMT